MNAPDDNQSGVCYGCIGDAFLSEVVKHSGRRSLCAYCGENREGVSLGDLADRIHAVLEHDFVLGSADGSRFVYSLTAGGVWGEPSGEPVEQVIAEIAGLEPEIADDLRELLSGRHSYVAIKDGEEDPYGVDAHYTAKGPDDWEFRETWSEFCRQIRSRSRFFSAGAEAALNSIFGDLATYRTSDGRPVILEISPTDDGPFFWRARKAHSIEELKAIPLCQHR